MAMRRLVWIVALMVVLTAGPSGAWFYAQSRGNPPRFRTAKIERGPLTATVSATGTLNAVVTVQVGSQVSGQIKELFADFNSLVKRNQLVARIDPEKFQAAVAQAKAQVHMAKANVLNQRALGEKTRADLANSHAALAAAKAQTAKAQVAVVDSRRTLQRNQDLRRRGFIAQADEDTAQATYDSAVAQAESAKAQEEAQASQIRSAEAQLRVVEAQLQSAIANVSQQEAGLRQAQVDLDHTEIRAPVDGVVVSRTVDVGQTVAASLQAPTLFTIAQDLTQMQVETNVDEADVGRIKEGQVATFTVDAYPSQIMRGTVRDIRSAPITVQNVVNYNAVIAVDNPELKLKPGMTATVSILVAQREHVLKIPKAALRFQPQLTPKEREQFVTAFQQRQAMHAPGSTGATLRRAWQNTPKVWTLTPEGTLSPVTVRLGTNDDQFSELQEGALQEGQELIIGLHEKDGRGTGVTRPG